MGMLRLSSIPALPHLFPGTPSAFQHVAWGVMLALALGSAGHLAEIFCAAYAALGSARLEQAAVLGLSRFGQLLVLAHEAAAIVAPPTGARLVHHLHNTAFAALFPIGELFGTVQGLTNASFRVFQLAVIGALIYMALSGCAWLLARVVETALGPSVRTDSTEGTPADDSESAIRFAR
jgi:ABC-type amino acid transport system permease subunit